MRCAYLTMDDLSDYVSDAELSIAPMAALGWQVDIVSWRDQRVNWDDYDAVYICTPWDYSEDTQAFLDVLVRIERSTAILINSLALVRWNLEKSYMRELQSRGVRIVPSHWYQTFEIGGVEHYFELCASDKVVIKPLVGASAIHTYVLERPVRTGQLTLLQKTFGTRPFFVQPFIDSIRTEGEYSVFYFGGDYSHTILKKPAMGDFRSQEEHGAEILSITAPRMLIDTGRSIISLLEPEPVYVRADFVRDTDGGFLLMELELIEPALYFRTDEQAAARFSHAINDHVQRRSRAGPEPGRTVVTLRT